MRFLHHKLLKTIFKFCLILVGPNIQDPPGILKELMFIYGVKPTLLSDVVTYVTTGVLEQELMFVRTEIIDQFFSLCTLP